MSWEEFRRKEYMKKWRAENREKVNEASRKYRAANRERARAASRKWRVANREKVNEASRKWQVENREKVNEANRKYRKKNLEKVQAWARKWKVENPEKVTKFRIKWRAENPEKVSEQRKKDMKTYHKKNRNNPIYKMHQNMRSAMSSALKGKYKSASTMKIIGCTVEKLFEHLESCPSWEPWMTREKYGAGGWDVDHIIAIAKWDKDCPLQFVLCWDKSNLQPMEHIANIKKGAR